MPTFPQLPLQQVYPVQTGISRMGFPTFGPLPGGVQNPPNVLHEALELDEVRRRQSRALSTPGGLQFTTLLAEKGGSKLWTQFAHQYRQQVGFVRGWVGTGLMLGAMGVTSLQSKLAKGGYDRLHPFEVDRSIRIVGPVPHDSSYPSERTGKAYAAASVLGQLWPARAYEFNWWARQTALAGVAAGTQFPSDVQVGARIGTAAGLRTASLLR